METSRNDAYVTSSEAARRVERSTSHVVATAGTSLLAADRIAAQHNSYDRFSDDDTNEEKTSQKWTDGPTWTWYRTALSAGGTVSR